MPTKREYNGWFNYETWLANLHFDDYFRDDAETILADCVDEFSSDDAATIREKATERLAEVIESTIADSFPASKAGLAADLCNAGFREIEFSEIASHYVDDLELYSAGWNMPGYMPESDPAVFLTVEAARDYIADELDRAADETEDGAEDTAADLEQAAARCREGKGEFGETVGNYHYWVSKV